MGALLGALGGAVDSSGNTGSAMSASYGTYMAVAEITVKNIGDCEDRIKDLDKLIAKCNERKLKLKQQLREHVSLEEVLACVTII